jgi:hypothetical protein
MQPDDLPTNYVAPDFLDTYAGPHGTGDTPDAAYLDLARQLSPERHRAR